MRLIPDWKKALRFFSVQADILTAGIAGAWLYVPDDMRAAVDPSWLAMAALALAVLGGLGRVVKQNIGEMK